MNSLQPCFPTQVTAWTRSRSTTNPKGGLALVAVVRAAWMALLVLAAWIGLQGSVRAQGSPGSNDPSFNVVDDGTYGYGANGSVVALALQPDGKVLIGGGFTTYNGTTRNGIARLNSDGSLDTSFDPGSGANNGVYALARQPDGKVLIGGIFTTYNGTGRNHIARLNSDGSLDTSFNPGAGVNGVSFPYVYALALQPDGKVLIGGVFTTYNGTGRNGIARLNSDGSLDASFNPGTGAGGFSPSVNTLALQPDGKVLIGGGFTTYNGTTRNYIARLNSDGSLDTSFNPGTGASSTVFELALQPDGKVLIGGRFTSYNGTTNPRNSIARLNSDGSLDTSFDPGTGANSAVRALALQSDGKVLIGGQFASYNGTPRNGMARLNSDGSLDTSFNPGSGANDQIASFALQPDGKVLIGGGFTGYNGTERNFIARLNSDGSLDTSFNPGTGASSTVFELALQPDGKVLIGGWFRSVNGITRNGIARLNSDGSLDTSFNPGTGVYDGGVLFPSVYAVALQPDGKVLIGGLFTTYNDIPRNGIARLNSDGSLDTSFNPGSGAGGVAGTSTEVNALALQPDGKVLIGGDFTSYNDTPRRRIARLNSDGSLDTSFDPGAGANIKVSALALQPDGKVLIGGEFHSYNGVRRIRIARLYSDGSLDTSFNPGAGANNLVSALALQPDGKVLIGGWFSSYNGITRNRIARLNSDGSLDTSFNPGTGVNGVSYAFVGALALQADGKLLIGGDFTSYNGTPRTRIARVHAYDPFPAYCGGPALACPCGNVGAGAAGCANSVSPGGALLAGAGMPSLANDTVVLSGSAMPNSSALYFQGTAQSATPFGDGLRCAAGSIIRIGTKTNTAGASSYPGLGEAPVSVRGAVPAGAVRHYQVWYRNAAAFCTPSSFNLTNGISVTWTP